MLYVLTIVIMLLSWKVEPICAAEDKGTSGYTLPYDLEQYSANIEDDFSKMAAIDREFLWAVCRGEKKEVQNAIDSGADLNARFPVSKETVLMLASQRGRVDIIKQLIVAGVEVNAVDSWGYTALVGAILSPPGNRGIDFDPKDSAYPPEPELLSEVVLYLLAAGADPNIEVKAPINRGRPGEFLQINERIGPLTISPIYHAGIAGYVNTFHSLLAAGALVPGKLIRVRSERNKLTLQGIRNGKDISVTLAPWKKRLDMAREELRLARTSISQNLPYPP